MAEREHDAFRRIRQNLARDRREDRQKLSQVEEVRLQLEAIAKQTAAKYQREVEATRPEAEEAVNQIIQPWFSELISSGTYAELARWSRSRRDVHLSDSIIHYWPKKALWEDGRVAGKKPYQFTAEFVVEHNQQDIQRGIQLQPSGDEVWYAGFKLAGRNSATIWREPVGGGGYGFSHERYAIHLNAQEINSSFDDISPEVWLEFGKQIENGQALGSIERSMRPRREKEETIDGATYRESGRRIVENYLRNRRWH
jgi:hypothetical protein